MSRKSTAAVRHSQLLVSGIVMQTFQNENGHANGSEVVVDNSENDVPHDSLAILNRLLFPGEEIFLQCNITKLIGNSDYEHANGKPTDGEQPAPTHHAKNDMQSMAGLLAITSYRVLFIGQMKEKTVVEQVPVAGISKVNKVGGQTSSKEQAYRLEIASKDGRVLRAVMPRGGGIRKAVFKSLKEHPNNYCFTYHTKTIDGLGGVDPGWNIYSHEEENARMGVSADWRITEANAAYALCPTYPAKLTVPAVATDALLQSVGGYRTKQRLPILSYYHWRNGTTITRASQPKPGMSRTRSAEDEHYIKMIRLAGKAEVPPTPMMRTASKVHDAPNSMVRIGSKALQQQHPPQEAGSPNGENPHALVSSSSSSQLSVVGTNALYIIDARPYANALGNMAKGAGWEIIDNYEACKIEFCGVENIHVMRDSLNKLRDACNDTDAGWYKALEASGWYNHLSIVLAASVRVARLVESEIPVLVHCSDGWDRTAQMVCLAMVMLDPYYRTIEGFMKMVDREWSQMGHQFALRHGHDEGKEDQRAPIFFQFLETLYQVTHQFPSDFEYNSSLLSFLNHHSHACLFGTFMTNCERLRNDIKTKTRSIWSYVIANVAEFKNANFLPSTKPQVLIPDPSVKLMHLWREEYFNTINYI